MIAPDAVLEPMESREEILKYWPLLKDSKIATLYGLDQLAYDFGCVLTGKYVAVKGTINGKLRVIVIFDSQVSDQRGLCAVIKQVWSPGAMRRFRDPFFAKLKEWGYSKVGGGSAKDTDRAFCRLLGLERKFTYFEKEI